MLTGMAEPAGLPAELAAAVAAAIDGMRTTWKEAAAVIDAWPDPEQALRAATEIAAEARAIPDTEGRALRGRQALRIRDARGLSLAQLADELGSSKSLAAKLVAAASAGTGRPADPHEGGSPE